MGSNYLIISLFLNMLKPPLMTVLLLLSKLSIVPRLFHIVFLCQNVHVSLFVTNITRIFDLVASHVFEPRLNIFLDF